MEPMKNAGKVGQLSGADREEAVEIPAASIAFVCSGFACACVGSLVNASRAANGVWTAEPARVMHEGITAAAAMPTVFALITVTLLPFTVRSTAIARAVQRLGRPPGAVWRAAPWAAAVLSALVGGAWSLARGSTSQLTPWTVAMAFGVPLELAIALFRAGQRRTAAIASMTERVTTDRFVGLVRVSAGAPTLNPRFAPTQRAVFLSWALWNVFRPQSRGHSQVVVHGAGHSPTTLPIELPEGAGELDLSKALLSLERRALPRPGDATLRTLPGYTAAELDPLYLSDERQLELGWISVGDTLWVSAEIERIPRQDGTLQRQDYRSGPTIPRLHGGAQPMLVAKAAGTALRARLQSERTRLWGFAAVILAVTACCASLVVRFERVSITPP